MNTAAWISAFRLRTLPLALASILMGGFLASARGAFRWDIFSLCILTTIFLQILSNVANDYGDSIHGADSEFRKGPVRAVQSGAISSVQMKTAVFVFAALSLVSGLLLLWQAFGSDIYGLLFFLGVGLVSIAGAIAYTIGRRPYGYMGLGDFSVLIFFGFVGVMGSYYLYVKSITVIEIFPALSCGFFSIAVLNINNIRDIDADRKAGKYSIPVRIGKEKAVLYHWMLLALGMVSATIHAALTFRSFWQLIFLLALPPLIRNAIAISQKSPEELDPYLRQMALSTLLFVILFGVGLNIAA